MERPPYPSPQSFRRAYTIWASAPGILGALLIVGYFAAVLDLGGDGWRVLCASIAAQTVALSFAGQWLQRRVERDIVDALELHATGRLTHAAVLRAYAAARVLPQRAVQTQVWSFAVAAVVCAGALRLAIPDSRAFTLVVIAVGSLTGGGACLPFALWAMQRFVASTRDWFAQQLSPSERAAHAPPTSLAVKVALPVVATAAATVAFLALLGYSVASRSLEAHDVRLKARFLASVAPAVRSDPARVRDLSAIARARGVASEVALVSLAPGAPPPAGLGLSARELAWLRASPTSSSRGIDSDASFAWLPLGGGLALVAASPLAELEREIDGTLAVVGLVLAGAIAVSLSVAMIVAGQTRRVAKRLREQTQRIGAGDFTPGAAIESDDELGAVAHAFALMAEQLGATIARVAEAAVRVDDSASELAKIGAAVREVTAAQVEGIERASSAFSVMSGQASEITGSTQELIGSVEEASSSALELGAASEELNQTAIALNVQVEAVGTSIDQMVRSVAHAGEASEALSVAVVDTNSSVTEMARSMQAVDAHAWETARLGARVIELADGGRGRVQETIRGMEAIRDATDSANRTIGGLATRIQEIGAIVDVIDEIADETNLLALNAAIIAAQAGDQGRAFSVVADEIKELADRVLANTKEIGGVIRSVQGESATASEAIRQSAEHVRSGVELSAQAGAALEEITAAARHAGERIQGIVQAMREQTGAATHVEQLSHGVRERVDQIRGSLREQSRGNEVVMRGSLVMRDVAHQTQRTTEEQAHGARRIRDSIEAVREVVDRIHASLEQQNQGCQSAAASLREVLERTRSNDQATDALGAAASALQRQAEALREDVRRFRVA